jgi:hypothetical protein
LTRVHLTITNHAQVVEPTPGYRGPFPYQVVFGPLANSRRS